MTPDTRHHRAIDERLCRALEPSGPAVERVARRALDAPSHRAAPGRWLATAAVALVVAALWVVPLLRRDPPVEAPEAHVSMVNVGSVVVLDAGRGRGTVLLSGVPADGGTPWRGQMIIQRGERP